MCANGQPNADPPKAAETPPDRSARVTARATVWMVDGFMPTPGQLALLKLAGHVGRTVAFKAARLALERIDSNATRDDVVRALKVVKEAGAVRFLDDELGNGINGTMGFRLTHAGYDSLQELKEQKRI